MMNMDVKILFREKNLIKKNLLMNLLILIKIYGGSSSSLSLILILNMLPVGYNKLNKTKLNTFFLMLKMHDIIFYIVTNVVYSYF